MVVLTISITSYSIGFVTFVYYLGFDGQIGENRLFFVIVIDLVVDLSVYLIVKVNQLSFLCNYIRFQAI